MRIGIVGSDNSHALAYAKIANVERLFGDHRVTMISGDEEPRTQEVAYEGQISEIVSGPDEMIGRIDAAIVVNRHGDLHAQNSVPLLEAGIPVYVDKPLAVSMADCRRIVSAARSGGTWVTSFSSLMYAAETIELDDQRESLGEIRAAQFAGPCDFDSEYAGPFFYATHVADVMTRLMGHDIAAVSARRSGKNVAVTVIFNNGALASITYMNDSSYHFTATLFGTEGYAHREIHAGMSAYTAAFRAFVNAVKTGKPPIEASLLDVPIRFVHAINTSLNQNGAEIAMADLVVN